MRSVAKIMVAVAAIVAAAGVLAHRYASRSLPVVNGSIEVTGISAPVDIVRDASAIPHIFGATRRDTLFGLGYVHAQDRLWQMEFQRRIGFGRLSEVFGAATLAQDRFLRTVGFGRAARSAWERLPSDARADVEAYCAGVNEFLGAHHGSALPPEFSVLRFEPEPWTGPDVILWAKMLAWDLSANYGMELLRHDLTAKVGAERMRQLMPPYPEDGLTILGSPSPVPHEIVSKATAERRRPDPRNQGMWTAAFASALGGGDHQVADFLRGGASVEGIGSNNWVVDGTLTASGRPLLANDPHLAARIPSTWYLVHLSAGDFDLIGATLPGTPAVAIGRNGSIAWGATNMFADVQDLYRERLDQAGTSAEFRGTFEPLRTIEETINVRGRPAVNITVRTTRHGPLVSDAINANNAASNADPKPAPLEPLAFRWTALDDEDQTVTAFLRLNQARDWTEFTSALREFSVPSQNFIFADREGHIGYYAPGHIPIRAAGDGSVPAEGWTGAMEWTGWIPFEQLPHVFDPPSHFIVTANNKPVPPDYPYFLSFEYHQPFRAQRITDLLRQQSSFTPDKFRDIQADRFSLHAQTLLPLLLRHVHVDDTLERQAVALLQNWNFDASGGRAEPAIFSAWFLRLGRLLVEDDLGEDTAISWQRRYSFAHRFITETIESGHSFWCDDVETPEHESCDGIVSKALHEAIVELRERLGDDVRQWRWQDVHRAIFPHSGLDAIGLLRPLVSRSRPGGGDWSTVNVGAVAVDRLFDQTDVPGYRQIVDLSPANESRFLDAVGESGHLLSAHYDDFLDDWQAVRHRPMLTDRAAIEKHATGRLTLRPR